jgi:hypothetical protein
MGAHGLGKTRVVTIYISGYRTTQIRPHTDGFVFPTDGIAPFFKTVVDIGSHSTLWRAM